MTTQTEAMKLALEALIEAVKTIGDEGYKTIKEDAAIKALEEALAKQEQSVSVGEPVAWVDSLFNEIKHGDEDHQQWLYEKLKDWALNNSKQNQVRPVAWRWGVPKLKNGKFEWRYSINKTREDAIPLYTKEQL